MSKCLFGTGMEARYLLLGKFYHSYMNTTNHFPYIYSYFHQLIFHFIAFID